MSLPQETTWRSAPVGPWSSESSGEYGGTGGAGGVGEGGEGGGRGREWKRRAGGWEEGDDHFWFHFVR